MRILFITSTRIGDAVLSMGILDWLLRENPEARATIVCGPLPAPLFTAVPQLERLIPLQKQSLNRHWLSLYTALRGQKFDLAVDLRNTPVSRLLFPRRLLTLPREKAGQHKCETLARLFNLVPPPMPRLWLGDKERAMAAERLPRGVPLLALAPTANWYGKAWPAARFVALARQLLATREELHGARLAIFGAPNERALAEPILNGLAEFAPLDAVGGFDIAETAALIARARLFVGNDSGLTHIAAAACVPTLGIFGPTDDQRYRPYGPRATFIRSPVPYKILQDMADHAPAGKELPEMFPDLPISAVYEAACNLLDKAV